MKGKLKNAYLRFNAIFFDRSHHLQDIDQNIFEGNLGQRQFLKKKFRAWPSYRGYSQTFFDRTHHSRDIDQNFVGRFKRTPGFERYHSILCRGKKVQPTLNRSSPTG